MNTSMEQTKQTTAADSHAGGRPASKKGFLEKLIAAKFLFLSILVHLLFIMGATIWVVQRFTTKPKQEFHGGPPGQSQATRPLEHKVQVEKQVKRMTSTSIEAKRVTTTGFSKVALPDMPLMAVQNENGPMSGGGADVNFSGVSAGSMSSGVGGGGVGFTMFGFHTPSPNVAALVGTFYDFRSTQWGKPTGLKEDDSSRCIKIIKTFLAQGWQPGSIPHYTAPKKLYGSYFFYPAIKSNESGKAFDVPGHGDGGWICHYKGDFAAPQDGDYRFIGFGDNVCLVRVDNKLVLDACDYNDSGVKFERIGKIHIGPAHPTPLVGGTWITMKAGENMPIEIVVGDYGGIFFAGLFIQKKGVNIKLDGAGVPQLPLFTVRAFSEEDRKILRKYLPDAALHGPVFTPKPKPFSGF